MAKSVFYFEHTDLFGGECNYCFLSRFAVMATTERGAKISEMQGRGISFVDFVRNALDKYEMGGKV